MYREDQRVNALLDLVVRGGTVVTADSEFTADVGVRHGRVVQLGGEMFGARELDAQGMLVIPGGVDMHVHLSEVELGDQVVHWADDFATGSRAAAAGGVTTIGNVTFPRPGESLGSAIERTAKEANRLSIVDFVLHPVLLDPRPECLSEIRNLAARGHASMKVFMILGEFEARSVQYLRAIKHAAASGMLTMIHCEDASIISFLTEELIASGQGAVSNYPASRPVYSEVAAVTRAIAFGQAAQAPIYIVHVSSAAALDVIRGARADGLRVYAETRPIYLYFTAERFEEPEGPLYVGAPPLRSGGDVEALWHGLRDGTVQTCCTDHAAWTREEKLESSLTIATAKAGTNDLETLLPLLFSEGVRRGRISLQRFVELTSTSAAKLFGLFPTKGTIAVGGDADLVVWDPEASRIVRAADAMSRAGFSLYEGWTVVGWPVYTISRGDVVFAEGRVTGKAGRGYQVRQRPGQHV